MKLFYGLLRSGLCSLFVLAHAALHSQTVVEEKVVAPSGSSAEKAELQAAAAKAAQPVDEAKPDEKGGGQMAAMSGGDSASGGGAGGAGGLGGPGGLLNFQADLFTGRFAYQVPIVVPPARQGAEPKLAIGYNSSGGNGWCGVGWGLEVGFIQRETRRGVPVKWGTTNPLTEYDDAKGFTFSMGGVAAPLVSVGGGEYRAETDGAFLKFQFVTPHWLVTDKSGNKFYFGETTNSRMQNPKAGWAADATGAFRWALNKVADVNGNLTTINYTNDGGALYLSTIYYNGNTNAPSIPATNSVEFVLENRPDTNLAFNTGYRVTQKKRLASISCKAAGNLARTYLLSYTNSGSTLRSLLASVTLLGTDGSSSLPPVSFTYTAKPFGFDNFVNWTNVSSQGQTDYAWNSIHGLATGAYYLRLMDLDADGLPDRVMRKLSSPYTYFSVQRNTGTNFANENTDWKPLTSADQTNSTHWSSVFSTDYTSAYTYRASAWTRDINGDGYPDRIVQNGFTSPYTNFFVQLSQGIPGTSAFAAEQAWGPLWAEPPGSGSDMYSMQFNTGFGGTSYSLGITDLMDMNGDGLPDRMQVRNDGLGYNLYRVQLNNRSGFNSQIDWSNVTWQGLSAPYDQIASSISWNAMYSSRKITFVGMYDLNGDGLPDRLMMSQTAGTAGYFVVQFNNGAGFEAEETWGPVNDQGTGDVYFGAPQSGFDDVYGGYTDWVTMLDINGDGLLDRVMRNYWLTGNCFTVQLNTGSGFTTNTVTWTNVLNPDNNSSSDYAWLVTMGATHGNVHVDLLDINGDGLLDRVLRTNSAPYNRFQVQYNQGPVPDLLQNISNNLGGRVDVAYIPSTQLDNRDKDWSSDPWTEGAKSLLPFPVYVAKTVAVSDGMGGSNVTTYAYKGGMFDSTNREFRGFNRVTVTDPSGASQVTYFHQGGGRDGSTNGEYSDAGSHGKKGIPYRVETYGTNGSLYTLTLNKVEETQLHTNGWYFPYISQTMQLEYEGLANYRATAKQFAYDVNTGNLTNETIWGEVTNVSASAHTFTDVSGDSVYTHVVFASLANPDIKNKPASIKLTADSGGSQKLRETLFYYDSNRGNLTAKVEWLDSPSGYITNSLGYDTYGNPVTSTNAVGIVSTTTYDGSLATFPVQSVTATFTNSAVFDTRSGGVVQATDVKGLVASNYYDVFFRVKETWVGTNTNAAPVLWRAKYDYFLGGLSNSYSYNFVRKRSYDPNDVSVGHESYAFSDGIGRTIQTRVESETNGVYRVADTFFDYYGRANFATLPYFSSGTNFTLLISTSALGTFTEFDPISRNLRVIPAVSATFNAYGGFTSLSFTGGDSGSPVGTNTAAYYDGVNPWASVSTDAEGKVRKSYHDAYGRVRTIIDFIGATNVTTTYAYDKVGNLTNVTDHAGNVTAIGYDSLGRKLWTVDPNMGTWTYAYDAAGRLTNQVDALNQKLAFLFNDPLGRITEKRIYNAASVCVATNTYYYDTNYGAGAGYDVYPGQLYAVIGRDCGQYFGYDIRGRTTRTTYWPNYGSFYVTDSTYDDVDRLDTLKYPGNPTTKLKYSYDTAGNLAQIRSLNGTGASQEFFFTNAIYNALGQLVSAKYGAVTVTNNFYANSKRLSQMRASNPAGGWHQDLSYTFDRASNVKGITDGVYTSEASATVTNLLYDDLHRLTSATFAAASQGTRTYGYNAIGNVLTNSEFGAGAYTYGAKPHAVTAANGKTYAYDACGNMTNRNGTTLVYDEENQLVSAGSVTFKYGPDGQRFYRQGAVLTLWIGSHYELRGSTKLCHVFANGRRIATFTPSSGTYASVDGGKDKWIVAQEAVERALLWPLQQGRAPITVTLLTLAGILGVSVVSRLRAKMTVRRSEFRVPRWQQGLSVWLIAALMLATTNTNVRAQTYTPVFYYYFGDHLGSSQILTDRAGVRVQHYENTGYGTQRYQENSSAFAVSHRYTGQVLDEETGLYYYGARYYDPELGRFIQPDSIVPDPTDSQSFNRYSYALNSPFVYYDPSGNDSQPSLIVSVYSSSSSWGGSYSSSSWLTSSSSSSGSGSSSWGNSSFSVSVSFGSGSSVWSLFGQNVAANWSQNVGGFFRGIGTAAAGLAQTGWNAASDPVGFTNAFVSGTAGALGSFTGDPSAFARDVARNLEQTLTTSEGIGGVTFGVLTTVAGGALASRASAAGGLSESSLVGERLAGRSTGVKNAAFRSNADLVQEVANRAENAIGGTGRFAGTEKHTYAKRLLDKYQGIYGKRGLETETTWLNHRRERYGTKGASRIDVLDVNANRAYDYKFTIKPPGLSPAQAQRIINNGPRGLEGVTEINPYP